MMGLARRGFAFLTFLPAFPVFLFIA